MRIAVYAPCKNEEKNAERWLENTSDADIRIVGDTGSTDRTLEILHPALHPRLHVHHVDVQPFRFDVARNTILSLVPGNVDVCISLDLDEVLMPGWRPLLEEHWKGANVAWVTYKAAGLDTFLHMSRVHARSGWYWRDPCHEAIKPWGIAPKIVQIPEIVIDNCHQDKTKSREHYLRLLAFGIDEEPWNMQRIFYYARELMTHQYFDKAIGWFLKYQELWKQNPEREDNEEFKLVRMYLQLCEGAKEELRTGRKQLTPMVR